MRIPLIAGNWKMNLSQGQVEAFAEKLKEKYRDTDVKTAICAPYIYLSYLKKAFEGTGIGVGAQNVHYQDKGAFTGEISVPMLEQIGVDYCIVGHSERRAYFGDTDEVINKKLQRLSSSSITPILCVGENLQQREAGREEAVVAEQLEKDLAGMSADRVESMVIAYEPIWAIGTGKTATPEEANRMCGWVRKQLAKQYDEEVADQVIIQYGGSMKPDNATAIMNGEEVDGGLVGGASLEADSLMEIIDF